VKLRERRLGAAALCSLLGCATASPPASSLVRDAAVSDSVCRFGGSAALPAPSSDGSVTVPATHPLLSYGGRVDCLAPGGPSWGFVGANLRIRFRGTGVSVRLKDFGLGTPQATSFYDVNVDGGAPRLLEVTPQREQYELAAALAPGEHEVELFKRGEASPGGNPGAGKAQLLGVVLHGQQLLAVRRPARRLEFVGDSITCGYGNEASTMTPADVHFTTRGSNAHQAYGAMTAQALGAEYLAVAYSGRGVSRNYAGGGGPLLPDLYLSSVPDDARATAWDPAQYVPDAVIVNLGTNDYSTPGVDRPRFVRAYTEFLARLRGYYPRAALVAALGPMLSDFYPPGEQAWSHAQEDVNAAVAARRAAGDGNLHSVVFEPQTGPWGEDWHPTAATHRKMADQLQAALQKILGW
jgi:lysophospholipase L1-like esterase